MAERLRRLANHFGGSRIKFPVLAVVWEGTSCEIFAPVPDRPDAALNGCELHIKPDFNF